MANDDEDDAGDEIDDDDDIDDGANYDDADDTGGGIPSHSSKSWSCPEHDDGDDIIISVIK